MKELNEYLKLRSRLYKLLGRPFYTESTAPYLEELKKHMAVFETMTQERENLLLEEGVKILKAFFDHPITEDMIDAHERLFVRLFLNVTGLDTKGQNINAQQSCYLSPARISMQDDWEAVYKMLCEENLSKTKGFTELEDHITAEFHFMAVLSDCASRALEVGNEKEFHRKMEKTHELMEQHLIKWIPEMCKDLATEARKLQETAKIYFVGIAMLTAGFLEYDREFIAQLTDAVRI